MIKMRVCDENSFDTLEFLVCNSSEKLVVRLIVRVDEYDIFSAFNQQCSSSDPLYFHFNVSLLQM